MMGSNSISATADIILEDARFVASDRARAIRPKRPWRAALTAGPMTFLRGDE
jgi:hypothetical protein